MNWEDLRYFQATAEAGNYTGAATKLKVNRTTVARRVEALEQQLGTSLLLWQGSQMSLSPSGERVLTLCHSWHADSEALLNELALGQQLVTGKLRIAAPIGLGPEFMPELAALSQRYPELEWELLNSLDPAVSLKQRRADLALYIGDQAPLGTRGKALGQLNRAVYASRAYLKSVDAAPESLPLRDMAWLRWGEDMPNSKISRWLSEHLPESSHCPARLNSWQAMKEAVLAGLGIAHLWCFLADEHPQLVRLSEPEPQLSMGLWLLQRSDLPNSVKLDAVEKTLVEAIGQRINTANA